MKVVALLSGGKDSCFNLLECLANGHEPIAVGGLLPTAGVDELDSFMFQTVGLSLLPSIAKALRLPLYTRVIKGTAVNVAGEYGSRRGALDREEDNGHIGTEGDETEDLYELLMQVKAAHPDLQAVSVGAILSSYQRVRVEQVCGRLGLTPLAYMWQASQSVLLDKIIMSGMECILVKVAGVGLQEKDLGKTLNVLESKLRKLNDMYGLHICGEGGEYETVTLDSPLFHDRIMLDETAITTVDASPVAPVAHLRILKATLQPKEDFQPLTSAAARALLDEALEDTDEVYMDEDSLDIRDKVVKGSDGGPDVKGLQLGQDVVLEGTGGVERSERGGWVCVGGVTGVPPQSSEAGLSLDEEVHSLFRNLKAALHPHSLTTIQSISLFLSSMADFPAVNQIYKQYFGTSPPTRACVATLLPRGESARVEAIAFVGREGEVRKDGEFGGRRGLHVQSLSYWAPANIGPYSQAVLVDNRLALAGQIPLIPASLTLPTPSSFNTEVALSLRHVKSIWVALKEGTGGSVLDKSFVEGCICWIDPKGWSNGGLEKARVGWGSWLQMNGHSSAQEPPTLFVAPLSLPRDALIEWQVAFNAGGPSSISDEQDESDGEAEGVSSALSGAEERVSSQHGQGWVWSACETQGAHWAVAGLKNLDAIPTLLKSTSHLQTAVSLKVFHRPDVPISQIQAALQPIKDLAGGGPALTFVAVERIATVSNAGWGIGLVWQGSS